jgi:tetratricopeptide (TPR) repeat protein
MDPSTALHIDRLATAVAKDPRSREFLPLADEYMKAGMWQEAAGVLEDGLKVYPGFVTAMVALGRVYDQLSQPVKAKVILEEVVKQRPDNLRAHRILAQLYFAEGKTDLALQSCRAILSANPSDEEARSIKRRITGSPEDVSISKRDTKPPDGVMERESKRIITPVPPTLDSSSHNVETSPQSPLEQIPDPAVVKHAANIARLDNWLRAIQLLRHDGAQPAPPPRTSSHESV